MEKYSFVIGFKRDSSVNKGHFGDADMFKIYEIEGSLAKKSGDWLNNNAGSHDEKHGSINKLMSVEQIIKGVDFIIAHELSPNLMKMAEKVL